MSDVSQDALNAISTYEVNLAAIKPRTQAVVDAIERQKALFSDAQKTQLTQLERGIIMGRPSLQPYHTAESFSPRNAIKPELQSSPEWNNVMAASGELVSVLRALAEACALLVDIAAHFGVDGTAFNAAKRLWMQAAANLEREENADNWMSPPIVGGSQLTDVVPARLADLKVAIQTKQNSTMKKDDPALLPLTPDETVLFEALTEEPQTGPDLVAKLLREKYTNFDESKISKLCGKDHMIARGVRHRKGAGYYRLPDKSNVTAR